VLCALVPLELIHASGAAFVRLCAGQRKDAERGAAELPRDTCPVVLACWGALFAAEQPAPEALDLVVAPITCDWKARLAQLVGERAPVLSLDVPRRKHSARARALWRAEVARLRDELGRLAGRKVDREALLRSVRLFRRATRATRRLVEHMRSDPPLLRATEAARVFWTAYWAPMEEWAAAAQALADALDASPAAEEKPAARPRLLLTGSPCVWPNAKVLAVAEEAGAAIVADETCAGPRPLCDAVALDEPTLADLLAALADRYLLPCTCPCFSPNDDRLERLALLAQRFSVDGAIYHLLRGCHLYDAELAAVRERLAELNVPVLSIETDYSAEDVEQIRVRVEAFVEMLRGREGRR